MRAGSLLVCLLGLALSSTVLADPTPVIYEGFDEGKVDGPVGKAEGRFSADPFGVVNMERGTTAFFYQSKSEPRDREWVHIGGLHTDRDSGYWTMMMLFQTRRQDFLFSFWDVGNYSPPMRLPTIFGRWKAGEWHHLAAVWDRREGIRIYEDGKEVFSNWGEHHWEFNQVPRLFRTFGPSDEVYVFAEPLTAAQIKQLADGKKPTGPAIAPSPLSKDLDRELARFGWTGDSFAALPRVGSNTGVNIDIARINNCMDAKRPVAYPFEGLLNSTWPSFKYGGSTRGQQLEISLDENDGYDRMVIMAHRDFIGSLAEGRKLEPQKLADVNIPRARFHHVKLDSMRKDTSLVLHREYGQMGHLGFYRAEPTKGGSPVGKTQDLYLSKADSFNDDELGKLLRAETARRHWNPISATAEAGDATTLSTPAFGGFQAFSANAQEPAAYTGVEVKFVAELDGPTPVQIRVSEPVDSQRVWLLGNVVLEPKGKGKQTYSVRLTGRPVIAMPPRKMKKYLKDGKFSETDTYVVPGAPIGVMVTAGDAVTWHMGKGGSSLHLITARIDDVIETAADDQIEWLREAYAERMEGHLYGDDRILTPLWWLAKFAPNRMETRQMWERVDSRVGGAMDIESPPKLVMPEKVNDTGAPDWAFWQMEAVKEHLRLLHYHIKERQLWTGEFGGIWNDDSTHVENWMGYMLSMDDDRTIRNAMDKYWHGLWNYQLVDGVGKFTQDSSHYSEEGSSNLGMRLLVDYGNPQAYNWTMRSASHFKYWVRDDGNGNYSFKNDHVGPWGHWDEKAMSHTEEAGKRYKVPLVPMAYLIWYNKHPLAGKYLTGLGVAGASNGNLLQMANDFYKDEELLLAGAREAMSQPLGAYPHGIRNNQDELINMVPLTDEQRKLFTVEYKDFGPIMHYWGSKNTEYHYLYWRATGDIRFLEDSYKRVCEWFYAHDWLNTKAMPSMDRNPLPRASLIRSRLGALPANRGSSGVMWPMHAISFDSGANDVASLVTQNLPNKFEGRFWAFTDQPHEMDLRIWRCNGQFKVTLSHDKNNDGKPEGTIWEKQMQLQKGAPLSLTIPAKQGVVLSIEPIKVEPINYDRPDPAISKETVELVYGDHLCVNVYNIGTQPVEDVLVRVIDKRSGKVVVSGEQHTGRIEAPTDLKPRFKMVEFKNLNATTWGEFIVEIDPEGKIDDFNPYNNRVEVKYKSTFDLPEGWQ